MPTELAMVPSQKGLQRQRVKVQQVKRPSDSLVEFSLERPKDFSFEPGQFVYIYAPDGATRRAYSIASAPHETAKLDITVKRVEGGVSSNYLYTVEPGDEVEITRALGGFKFRTPPELPVVFLATGTGVAPFRSMVLDLIRKGDRRPMWLFLGSRDLANLPYRRDFELLEARHRNFRFVPVLSRAPLLWEGDRGWIQEAYLKRFFRPRPLHAYVCGLKRMVDDVRVMLQERGLSPAEIHVERYD